MNKIITIKPLDDAPYGSKRPKWLWKWRLSKRQKGQLPASESQKRDPLRKILRRKKPVFDLEYNSLKLRLYPAENICDLKLVMYGAHPASEQLERVDHLLKQARVFVDIGANVGLYSLIARQRMPPSARILSFEPDPRTVRKLRQNLDFNGATNVTVIHGAVGSEEGYLPLFNASSHNVGRNTLVPNLAGDDDSEGINVPVRPLISYLEDAGIDQIDVLKIDVEGFEAEVLAPFLDQANKDLLPKYIMIEVVARDYWKQDVISMCHALGYETVYETSDDMHLEMTK
jgi:FkbM family methyltransferase